MKWLFRSSVVLSFATAVWAGIALVRDDTDQPLPPFLVSQTEFELSGIAPGPHELVIPITNTAGVPRSIIGICETCDMNCCYWTNHKAVVIVGPGETFDYTVRLDVKKGQFEAEINIFLEENGIRKVVIHVTGTAVEDAHAPE